jgi:hypothetical protein
MATTYPPWLQVLPKVALTVSQCHQVPKSSDFPITSWPLLRLCPNVLFVHRLHSRFL